MEATVPAGMVLYVEQTVGYCDGSTVETELFRLSQVNGSNVVSTRYEYTDSKGETFLLLEL